MPSDAQQAAERQEAAERNKMVCEFLGIAGKVQHDSGECDLKTYDYGSPWRMDPPKCTCTPETIYPDLSSWQGFGLVVEALRKRELAWNCHIWQNAAVVIGSAEGFAATIPEAMLLAVAELARRAKG